MGQLTQLVVETATCASRSPTAPLPAQAECRSGVPVTTTVSSPIPSVAATSGETVPIVLALGRSGGSFSAGTPEERTRTGS